MQNGCSYPCINYVVVMKAEFAADLNNLSNRMAQLENSLDAKIDSLVSSYLI